MQQSQVSQPVMLESPDGEELVTSQEMTEDQVAQALLVVDRIQHGNLPDVMPPELKHLRPMDWEMLSHLWLSIKQEMVHSRLH